MINGHKNSPKKCPRKVTQKCPRNVTQKEDFSWTKVSTKCHQKCPWDVTFFCPRDITDYVHEISATLFKTVNLSYAHIPVFLRELKIHIFPLQNYNLKCKTFWNEILRWIGLMLLWVLVLYSCVGFQEVSHLTWKRIIYFLLG